MISNKVEELNAYFIKIIDTKTDNIINQIDELNKN